MVGKLVRNGVEISTSRGTVRFTNLNVDSKRMRISVVDVQTSSLIAQENAVLSQNDLFL
jgi:hypothetical protein